MHFQAPPHEENKIVSCSHGAIHDVIVDLRPASKTYFGWLGVDLTAEEGTALYVPKGFAHGFLTLADDTIVSHDISTFYVPESGRGLRFDDPAMAIRWPFAPTVISERDRGYASFGPPGS